MNGRLAILALLGLSSFATADQRPERIYDLLDVNWQISFDEPSGTISGDVTNTLRPLKSIEEVWFDSAKLRIQETLIDGKAMPFRLEGERLFVRLPKPADSSRTVKVRIRYSGQPEAGVYFVPAQRAFPATTSMVYTQGEMEDTRYWLPTYDYPDDKATTEGRIEVPKGYRALSNGRLIGQKAKDDREVWHWRLDKPHSTYLISFVAGPYTEVVTAKKPKVSYWVPKGLEEQGQVSFGNTHEMVDFFGKLVRYPYPFAKYSQSTVADFMFGGMENTTATTQTITTLHPKHVEPLASSTGLVAHELAHQWFGDTVTTPNWAHIWINEGWASFLPAFWTREKVGDEAFHIERFDIFSGGLAAHQNSTRPVVWTGYREPMEMFNNFAYPGGASRMFMLMHQIGEAKFWPAVGNYLREYQFKNVDTEGFFASMSRSTGRDLETFRRQWFYTPAAPRLTVKRIDGQVVVEQPEPHFDLPLEVMVVSADGRTETRPHRVQGARTAIPDVQATDLVLVDPEAWTMMTVTYDLGYRRTDWRRLFDVAPNAAQKLRLLDPVMAALSRTERVELAQSVTSPRLLARIVPRVPSREFLLEMTRHGDATVRQAAVGALGGLSRTADVETRLMEIVDNEPNDILRRDTMRSLIRMTGNPQLLERAWSTNGYADIFRVLAIEHWAERDPEKGRTVALDVLENPPSEPVRVFAIRALGRLKDPAGDRRAYDALIRVAQERSFGARTAAINALAQYGDKSAISVLQPLSTHSLSFIRNAAKSAVERLQKK